MILRYVPDLGVPSPAAVNRLTGELFWNRKFDYLPVLLKQFIVLHEEGHYVLQTQSEEEADLYALQRIIGTAENSCNAVLIGLTQLLDFDSEFDYARFIKVFKKCLEYECRFNNIAAANLLNKILILETQMDNNVISFNRVVTIELLNQEHDENPELKTQRVVLLKNVLPTQVIEDKTDDEIMNDFIFNCSQSNQNPYSFFSFNDIKKSISNIQAQYGGLTNYVNLGVAATATALGVPMTPQMVQMGGDMIGNVANGIGGNGDSTNTANNTNLPANSSAGNQATPDIVYISTDGTAPKPYVRGSVEYTNAMAAANAYSQKMREQANIANNAENNSLNAAFAAGSAIQNTPVNTNSGTASNNNIGTPNTASNSNNNIGTPNTASNSKLWIWIGVIGAVAVVGAIVTYFIVKSKKS